MQVTLEDLLVDVLQRVESRKRDGKHAEVSLQSRVDGEATSCRVHAADVLNVVHLLELQLDAVVPMLVVQMLADQCVRLDGAVCVNLNKHSDIA